MPAPQKPAMQSGPGALSQRTDGGPASKQAVRYASGMPYGEGQDFLDIQSSAAMEKATPVRPASQPSPQVSAGGQQVVPLTAPTQRPNEPITSGVDAGAGPGMDSLGLNTADNVADQAYKQQIASYMPVLMYIASRSDTSPETRNVIRQLRESM